MDRLAKVVFTGEEAVRQKHFLEAMASIGMISLSKEEILEEYKMMKTDGLPRANHIVLKGDEETERFKSVMKCFFKEKEYVLEDRPS